MISFDRKFARLLLEICRYTYSSYFDPQQVSDAENWINQIAEPDSKKTLKSDNDPQTSVASIFSYPDKNIVSYMGTMTQFNNPINSAQSLSDWLENIDFPLVPFKLSGEQLGLENDLELGGLVHQGFLRELGLVQAKVVKELEDLDGRKRPLYITGHSQGGAEAALATRAFIAAGYPVAATYTFASPRPGNFEFAQTIPTTLPFHRIEFGDDIVPHVPTMLISNESALIVDSLLKIPNLPLPEQVLRLLKYVKDTTNAGYVGVGKLCYGSPETKALRVDISADEEAGMFNKRLIGLIANPGHWTEHHDLAGTTEDKNAGRKGNYTALVSIYSIVG